MKAPVVNVGWLKLSRFCEWSGYTPKAVERKRASGAWPEGPDGIWKFAPDGNVHVNWERYQAWVNTPSCRAG